MILKADFFGISNPLKIQGYIKEIPTTGDKFIDVTFFGGLPTLAFDFETVNKGLSWLIIKEGASGGLIVVLTKQKDGDNFIKRELENGQHTVVKRVALASPVYRIANPTYPTVTTPVTMRNIATGIKDIIYIGAIPFTETGTFGASNRLLKPQFGACLGATAFDTFMTLGNYTVSDTIGGINLGNITFRASAGLAQGQIITGAYEVI